MHPNPCKESTTNQGFQFNFMGDSLAYGAMIQVLGKRKCQLSFHGILGTP